MSLKLKKPFLEKVELVKAIIVNLAHNVARTRNVHEWESVPLAEFIKKDVVKVVYKTIHPMKYRANCYQSHVATKPGYSLLFSTPQLEEYVNLNWLIHDV